MSLSINPLAKLVSSISQSVSQATNSSTSGGAIGPGDVLTKAQLDKTIGILGGELNSGLNGMAGALGAAGNSGSLLAGAKSALGNIGGVASVLPNGASLDSLKSVVGSTSNITADISGSLSKLTGGNLAGGFSDLMGSISKGAGMLNNILSLKRGANLPSGGEIFAKQGAAIQLAPGSKNDWRVRLQANWSIFPESELFKLLKNTGGVTWPYLPNIQISTKANYNTPETIHSNYAFYSYKNSAVEDIQISGDFSCETEVDAAYWIATTTFFKTATKMFFGQGAQAGNPPIICNLTGYGSSVFDNVPVIIKSFSVDLKDDVNYIRCTAYGLNTWVPVLSTVSVTVAPIYNRARLRQFNLQDYASGKTVGPDGIGFI
jgi:hypothetical protein